MVDFPGLTLDLSALDQAKTPEPDHIYHLLILGGGPAAMSAAIYAARKMLDLALITKDFGGQMRETSGIENWLGFQSIDAQDLLNRFQEHVKSFDLPIELEAEITSVEKEGELFKVKTASGKTFSGKAALYALGNRHRLLGVPGEKELTGKGVAYCATCDAPFFKGKKVAVAGGGNSAFTTALDLVNVDADITMINFLPGWQADPALQERVKQHKKLELLDNHQILEVIGTERVEAIKVKNRQTGEEKTIAVNGLFVEIGLIPNTDPVKNLVKLNHRGEVEVDCACKTSVPGLFAAGDVSSVPYKQIIIAAGEGAKAALSAYDYLVQKGQV